MTPGSNHLHITDIMADCTCHVERDGLSTSSPPYHLTAPSHLLLFRRFLMILFKQFSTRGICFFLTFVASALAFAAASSPAATPISDGSRPWLDGHSTALPLLSKKRVSRDTVRYTFSTNPNGSDERQHQSSSDLTLGIPVCSCLLVSPPDDESLTRPYTPISSRHTRGQFELLVKHYPDGAMGRCFAQLRKGDCMMFRQIPKNIKELYPFGKPKTIIMLAAGTGITPMYQALQRLFGPDEDRLDGGDEGNDINVILLYGSRTKRDIYLRKELSEMAKRSGHRLKVVHALSDGKVKANGEHEVVVDGMITKGVIALMTHEEIFRRGTDSRGRRKDCKVWVCGPPGFYSALCGPREDDGPLPRGCALRELGFRVEDVVKF